MQSKNKLLSHFLLATYLLVVLHDCISHTHSSEIGESPVPVPSHQHEDFETVHHEHSFHIGIFHFLGHLFESANHQNDLDEEQLILSKQNPAKKAFDQSTTLDFYFIPNSSLVSSAVTKSPPNPPHYLSLLQKLKQPNNPLRAPPAFI